MRCSSYSTYLGSTWGRGVSWNLSLLPSVIPLISSSFSSTLSLYRYCSRVLLLLKSRGRIRATVMLSGRRRSDWTPPSWPVRCRTGPTSLPLYTSQKYLPTCSTVACFYALAVVRPAHFASPPRPSPAPAAPLHLVAAGHPRRAPLRARPSRPWHASRHQEMIIAD
jgi:hypothetical protein